MLTANCLFRSSAIASDRDAVEYGGGEMQLPCQIRKEEKNLADRAKERRKGRRIAGDPVRRA
jgi:hypothetical protein